MATKAILHAEGQHVGVRVFDHGLRPRVEVSSSGATMQVQRNAAVGGEPDKGLLLVEAMAAGWGVDARPSGTAYWFEIGV